MTSGDRRSKPLARATMRPTRPAPMKRWGAALLAVICLSPAGVAAEAWVGTTSDWTTPSNWIPSSVPVRRQSRVIQCLCPRLVTNVTNASGSIGGLVFTGNAPSFTIALGFQGLTLNGIGIINNNPSVVQTITGGGTSGILTINGGTLNDVNLLMTSSNVNFRRRGVGRQRQHHEHFQREHERLFDARERDRHEERRQPELSQFFERRPGQHYPGRQQPAPVCLLHRPRYHDRFPRRIRYREPD